MFRSARSSRYSGYLSWCVTGILLAVAASSSAADVPVDAALPSVGRSLKFEADVIPVLRAYCWKCHGGEALEADLDLRSFPLALRGGKTGPVIVPGSALKSALFLKAHGGQMPPGDSLKPTSEHLTILRDWIDAGAAADYQGEAIKPLELSVADREWWAFRPPVKSPVPEGDWASASNPIDGYLLGPLNGKRLRYSESADRGSWIRRASFDLIGLPPRPEDVDEFLADESADAFDRLADRLLASPHYGERWGRHWLDASGYVDTIATDNDASIIEERERVWLYRDYVIRAFNADKPFDRFLLEQLAGDELVDWKSMPKYDPATIELLTATGFLRQAADVTYAPELNTSDIRHQVLFDTVQILASNLLGLTMHCAQCHDHKFDPISQAEYFQLTAFFAPAYDPQHWKHSKDRVLFDVPPSEQAAIDQHNTSLENQIAERKQRIAQARLPFAQRLADQKLSQLPEVLRADTQAAVNTPADKRNVVQKFLADKLGPLLAISDSDIDQALDDATRQATATWSQDIQQFSTQKKSYGKLQALWNLGTPRSYLYRRGDHQLPGPEVLPAVPAVLVNSSSAVTIPADISGRRLALAKWLTQPDHPLTSRVFVNRVWQNFFGRGLVVTPDNFGASGAMPSHPELLDWLAMEFVRHAWSVKQLQRKILATSAYRQTSRTVGADPQAEAVDPENLLLWRMPLRRLESESVRDNLLAVSGALDETQFGPPLPLKPLADGRVEIDVGKLPPNTSPHRRSLYLFNRRNYQLTEMSVFDQPVVSHNCTRRISTAVVLQSLTMLNGGFSFEQAEKFATRVRENSASDGRSRIECAYRLALSREPDKEELAAAEQFLQQQTARFSANSPAEQAAKSALENLCQMLMNSSEFLYVP